MTIKKITQERPNDERKSGRPTAERNMRHYHHTMTSPNNMDTAPIHDMPTNAASDRTPAPEFEHVAYDSDQQQQIPDMVAGSTLHPSLHGQSPNHYGKGPSEMIHSPEANANQMKASYARKKPYSKA